MADMKHDRAALVEKVVMEMARALYEAVEHDTRAYELTKDEIAYVATAAIDLIRAETLEEAADAVGEVGDCAEAGAYINAIRALKDTT